MKILAINSSRRNGNTFHLLLQIQAILKDENIDVEIINLYDFHIKCCVGCENCLIHDKCNLKDDTQILFEKLKESDGIILSSPVYLQSVSGILKTFVDRTCSWYHRPVLFGKPILVVSTTKGSGLKNTLKYLENIGIQWGMLPSGMIGRSIINIDRPIERKECESFIKNLKIEKIKHCPPLRSIINFNVQKVLSNNLIGLDSDYWRAMKWDVQYYYYDCKVNVVKKSIGWTIYTFLNLVMSKNKNA